MLDSTGIFGEEFAYMKRTQRQLVPTLSDEDIPYYDPNDYFSTMKGNLYFRHFNTLWISEPNKKYQKCPHCKTLKTGSGCIGCGFDFTIFQKEIARYDYLIDKGFEEAIKAGKMTREEWSYYKWYNDEPFRRKIHRTIFPEIDLKATKQVLKERLEKIGQANVTPTTFGVTEEQYQKQRLLDYETNIHQTYWDTRDPFEIIFENFPVHLIWIIPLALFCLIIEGGIAATIMFILFSIYGMHRYKVIHVTRYLEELKKNDALNKYMKK